MGDSPWHELPADLSHEVVELKGYSARFGAGGTEAFPTVGCTNGYSNDALSGLLRRFSD